jgi:peptidoglycan/xylan/chitin deacetylase (PgdA/CDA1 family)
MTRWFRPVVLCYHAVSERWTHELSVAPESFERQLEVMLSGGYRAVEADELVAGRGRLLHVTFDDAYSSIASALPVLRRMGVPATVFVCTAYAGDGRPLDVPELATEAAAHPAELATLGWAALAEIADGRVRIGSHTRTHPHLTQLSDGELRAELLESRRELEDRLARPCGLLAYPYGEHDDRVRRAASASGYTAAFALPGRTVPLDVYAIPRVGVWRQTGPLRLRLKTSALRHPVGLLRDRR